MKNTKLIYIITSFFIFTTLSCSKSFLEIKPKGRIIAGAASDYNNILEDNLFVYLSSSYGALTPQHILGDDVAGLEPHFSHATYFGTAGTRQHQLFQWADDIYRPDEDCIEMSGLYERVYTANKIIHEVLTSAGGTDEQKKQYHAEALCQRAFAYFILANYFGKPYSNATAGTDLAVPLVLVGDFAQAVFERSTVKAVYDQMIADLTEAIPFLPLKQTNANRFTKAAGEALLGKVYLFMGNSSDAVTQLDNAVQDLPAGFAISGVVGLINYNTAIVSTAPLGYPFLGPVMGTAASQGHGYPETLNAQLIPGVYWLGYAASLVINPETYALFKPSDLRRKLYVNTYSPLAPGSGPTLPAGLYRTRAFIGNSIGIQVPDIYLLRAEAKARENDISGATASLLTLRSNRMPAADAALDIPTEKAALVKFIIEERRREFAMLGFRWFDMRRLSVDPLFPGTPSYKHDLYSATGSIIATYTFKPERFVMRFSKKLVAQSPGLIDNP